MMFKMLAVTAMSFGFATAALAQSDANGSTGSAGGKGDSPQMTWDAPINDTFFSDENGTMRPEADVSARWSQLSAEQQDKVRKDCANVDTSNASMSSACDWVKKM